MRYSYSSIKGTVLRECCASLDRCGKFTPVQTAIEWFNMFPDSQCEAENVRNLYYVYSSNCIMYIVDGCVQNDFIKTINDLSNCFFFLLSSPL